MKFLDKKKLAALVLIASALFSFSSARFAQAGAVIVLKGELYSVNQYDIQIKTKSSIFRVSRDELTPAQKKQVEAPGVSGKIVQLELPMTAIKQVRPLKPQNK